MKAITDEMSVFMWNVLVLSWKIGELVVNMCNRRK